MSTLMLTATTLPHQNTFAMLLRNSVSCDIITGCELQCSWCSPGDDLGANNWVFNPSKHLTIGCGWVGVKCFRHQTWAKMAQGWYLHTHPPYQTAFMCYIHTTCFFQHSCWLPPPSLIKILLRCCWETVSAVILSQVVNSNAVDAPQVMTWVPTIGFSTQANIWPQ